MRRRAAKDITKRNIFTGINIFFYENHVDMMEKENQERERKHLVHQDIMDEEFSFLKTNLLKIKKFRAWGERERKRCNNEVCEKISTSQPPVNSAHNLQCSWWAH